jgi:hypothetical protein
VSSADRPGPRSAIARDFASPGAAWRGKSFWSWNGELETEELRRQIRVMRRMGFGGFFIYPGWGLATPYLSRRWFECVKASIDEAKKLKMEVWLYDEERWPSGSAGGLATKKPSCRNRMLRFFEWDDPAAFRWTPATLAAFTAVVKGHVASAVRPIPKGRRPRLAKGEKILSFVLRLAEPSSWYNGQTYLDTLNPTAVREFIRVTHEAYRRECGRAFGKLVRGIFSDEPNTGLMMRHGGGIGETNALPWTDALPKLFRERYGYDLLPHLPELCYDIEGLSTRTARYHFLDLVTHLFVTAFSKQIGDWCARNHLLFTGHVLMEDTLSRQVALISAPMRFYEHMQAPGMDLLTARARYYDTAKQVSSVARQFGRKWRFTETYGCTGWDLSFAGLKAISDWQTALGINLRCEMLYWYTMKGEIKRDYPTPVGAQSPWWTHYAKLEDYFARLNAALTPGEEVRDLLVIHPVESIWLEVRKGWSKDPLHMQLDEELGKLRDDLLAAHLDFDYGDEEILSRHLRVFRREGVPLLRVGRATYKAVLAPPMTTMRRTTLRLLEQFHDAGGRVVFAGRVAACVDAVRDPGPAALAGRCPRTPARGPKLAAALDPLCRRVSIADAAGKEIAGVLYLLREDRDAFRLFICNTGYTAAQFRRLGFNEDRKVCERRAVWPVVRLRGFAECAGAPEEWDPATGRRFAANAARAQDGAWEIATDLPVLGSRLFVLPKGKTRGLLARRPTSTLVRRIATAARPWEIALSERNVLVLDKARCRIAGRGGEGEEEILRLDRRIRRTLGVPARSGGMVQPWARKQQARQRSIPVLLEYRLDVDALPEGELLLALESPDRFAIGINGRAVSSDAARGWWVNPSLKLVALDPAWLRLGENRLRLDIAYTEDDGLEIIYLLGDFGVKLVGGEARIVAAPERLEIGDWTAQGLPFYSGSVCYRRAVATPRLLDGERLFVRLPSYHGVAARVLVNGREAGFIGWEPNEADVTDFIEGDTFELGIEVLGHRRNSHGPLHFAEKSPAWIGPEEFISQGEQWADAWNLVPCGLMESPRLEIRRPFDFRSGPPRPRL